MKHTSGKMEADGGFLYEISGNPNNRLLLEFGRYVSQEEAEANAERIRDLWNAFDGIPTHEAMNIIQVAQSLSDNPKDRKYLEYGKEMESLIKLVNLQIANLLRFHANARTLQRFSKELINKLEVNDERA